MIVAGNSLGGWTTLRVAERDDLPIAGIIPVAPAGIAMSPWFLRLDRMPGVGQLLRVPGPVPEVVTRAVVARTVRRIGFGDPAKVDERFVRSFSLHNRNRRWAFPRMEAAKGCAAELEQPVRRREGQGAVGRRLGHSRRALPDQGRGAARGDARREADRRRGLWASAQVEAPESVLGAIDHLS